MAVTHDQPPTNPSSTTTPDSGGGSSTIADNFATIFPLVLGGAFILGLCLAFLILWLTRRRQRRHNNNNNKGGTTTTAGPNTKGDDEAVISVVDYDTTRSSHDTTTATPSKGGGSGNNKKWSWGGSTTRRRLQKACSVGGAGPGVWSKVGVCGGEIDDGEGRGWPRRHMSMPLIPRACSKGHFHFGFSGGGGGKGGSSCCWPGEGEEEAEKGVCVKSGGGGGGVEMGEVRVCKEKKSWIDEDALHGPKVSSGVKEDVVGKKMKRSRGSSPLRNRAPTLPRVHHTVHGYPYLMSGARGESSEALLGEKREQTVATGMDYAQLRAFSRVLPEPPKPALVASRDRRGIRPSVTMGYVYGASRIPKPVVSPPTSPIRSAPTTPLRHRGRQRSTDSTLSEILRSTEQRLREGSVSATVRDRRETTSPTRASPGKVLGPRDFQPTEPRARTPSPNKAVSNQSSSPGHQRQESQQSVSSEADSLVGEECPNPDMPSGLTSPSRVQKPQAERQPMPAQSVRTSLSSELSTLYSEDEMPEEVKRAIMPLEGFVVQPQQAANVGPPSVNDPFVTAPPVSVSRTPSLNGWPAKHSKSQDLLRRSMQQSQRLRSMTVGHVRAQSHGLILAPGPVVHKPKPNAMMPVIPPSRKASVTIPPSMQPYVASRASEPPPTPTRPLSTTTSPSGPLFLRVTKTSTLSTIPLLPPPSAPGFDALKETRSKPSSPAKTSPKQEQQQAPRVPAVMLPSTERSPTPPSPTRRVGGELRLSLILPHKQLQDTAAAQKRTSASSSLYSQESSPHPSSAATQVKAAMELNRAGFAANSSLYPAPLAPARSSRGRPASASKLWSEVSQSNDEREQEEVGGDEDDEDTPLALTSTIASLRRMNSGVSTASSLRSIADREPDLRMSPSPSPDRAPGVLAVQFASASGCASPSAAAKVSGGESPSSMQREGHRKSIGARNYFILGNTGDRRQSRRLSRVVSAAAGTGGGGGIVKSASNGGVGSTFGVSAGSPYKRRRAGSLLQQQRRASYSPMLQRSATATEVAVGEGEEGKENKAGNDSQFKVAAGEFTFEVTTPNNNVSSGKGALGLREGSSGSVNALVMTQRDSPRWRGSNVANWLSSAVWRGVFPGEFEERRQLGFVRPPRFLDLGVASEGTESVGPESVS